MEHKTTKNDIKRMDIYLADLSEGVGSEQEGVRPVLVIQNDVGNRFSPTVIVSSITGEVNKAKLPTHIEVSAAKYGLDIDSIILLEQIRTIDKKRLLRKITHIDGPIVKEINRALKISLALIKF
ncbi:type II toxin-antitoxin system PemK/MazF family toxin [Viridibacillus arvi]|uniref:type II toxin-antitoxin system PemK/MazF family toxin n=1 Tax=Viridibacillus arvi TaxID=263475 RepID=UPI0034CEE40E